MKEAKRLSTLKKDIDVFKPAMVKFHQEHRAYKLQVAVSIVFHKAVDPTVVTHPPVVLTSEMVAVYTDDTPPLVDVNRHPLNFIEVCEQNGSGWHCDTLTRCELARLFHYFDPNAYSCYQC